MPEGVVERLVPGARGEGLMRVQGKVLFVPLVLPGERVRVRVTEESRDWLRGELEELLTPSPLRTEPACPLFGACGGCSFQHILYPRQALFKKEMLQEALSRTGGLRVPEIGLEPSPAYAYRSRVRLHRDKNDRIGFMKRNSRALVPVPHCPVCVPPINAFLQEPDASTPESFVLFASGERCFLEGREPFLELKLLGRRIRFEPAGFFQSNLEILPRLVSKAIEGLEGGLALDLYCGAGLFGAFLAGAFRRVACVDRAEESIRSARRNLPAGGHLFFARDADAWVLGEGKTLRPEAVVADPPRAGLSPVIIRYLLEARPRRIRYVSCDPVTLARDLGRLSSGGYRLDAVTLFDFYPQTSHIESLASLSLEVPK